MAYAIHYTGEFTNLAEQPYQVEILELDYVGDTVPLLLSGTPVKHKWQTDEPMPPIQGSSVVLSFINTGSLPLTSFYSNNDNQFQLKLYWDGNLIFIGLLVQDDCQELMVDFNHEVSLSFNDNLGLLKDFPLNQGLIEGVFAFADMMFDFISPSPTDNCFIYIYNTDFIPQVGVPFEVANHIEPAANSTWTPTAVTNYFNGNWKVQVADFSFTDMKAWPSWINIFWTFNPYGRHTLLNIIGQCLKNTSLELDVKIYANIFEDGHDTSRSFLEQTYIDTTTFLNDKEWKNCWDVLTEILTRFDLSLFQAEGAWHIVRWQDMRDYATPFAIPGFVYTLSSTNLTYSGTTTFANFFTAAFNGTIYPEYGLIKSINRPWKFDQETFDYKQSKYLLKNWDLQTLGALFSSGPDGANTVSDYFVPDWYAAGVNIHNLYIRVVTVTATGKEIERYMIIEVPAPAYGETGIAAQSTAFEVNAGDKVIIEYTFRTSQSNPGAETVQLGLSVFDGTTTLWANEDLTNPWVGSPAWTYTLPGGDDSITDHDVKIEPAPIPNDGIMYIYLPQFKATPAPGAQTFVKNIRLTYIPTVNGVTQITGHKHKAEQDETIKNNSKVDLMLDNSPRNSIVGTLFTPNFTSLIEDRTSLWYIATDSANQKEYGELSTTINERWKQVPRAVLQGNFVGLIQTSHISWLAIMAHGYLPDINFIFGLLEIDYKNNSFNCTQYEIYKDGEGSDVLPDIDYTFEYIYSNQ